jgi:hypothetical protein
MDSFVATEICTFFLKFEALETVVMKNYLFLHIIIGGACYLLHVDFLIGLFYPEVEVECSSETSYTDTRPYIYVCCLPMNIE